jgi:hypothetical protein
MLTLSASNSVLQLAFGVNAVLPVLISDFQVVRNEAADSLLRKIKEYRPDFELKERDRIAFMDFTFRSSRGLRFARLVTHVTGFLSLALCGLSLAALCWSAVRPNEQISSKLFLVFVGVTLIGAPSFYLARNLFLKWFYSAFVVYGTNEKSEMLLFADRADTYLTYKKDWEIRRREMDELMLKADLLLWKVKLIHVRNGLKDLWYGVRSKLRLKRNR